MPPAQLRARQLGRTLDEELLDVVLLQVDERGPAVPGFRQQIELVYLLVAEEYASDAPTNALLHDTLAAAEPVEDLERAFGPADRA
jgi:hypothetical protein